MTLFVAITFCGPLFDFNKEHTYTFLLNCSEGTIYRKYYQLNVCILTALLLEFYFIARRFLFVFASDFVSALVSILIIMCEKRFTTDKERLKLARTMEINALTEEIQSRTRSTEKKRKKSQNE